MTDPATAPSDDETRTSGLRRLGVIAVVLSFVGIWGYVMYLSVFVGRAEPRDRLDDELWAKTAQDTCASFDAFFAGLPYANEVGTPAERADLLDTATDELDVMVRRLADIAPPSDPEEARAVESWLADYRTYLADRREYADALRDPDDPRYDEPFSVTDRGGFQIDVLVDDFAHVNYMESCETPDDVG